MSGRRIHVIGAGGHAKVVVRTLLDCGYLVQAIFDDNARRWGSQLLGCPVCGPVERIENAPGIPAIIAIGDNGTRQAIARRFDLVWATVAHPSALVDSTVRLGRGTVVLHRAVIQPDCRVGDHAIVNTAATVDHDCVLGDFSHVAPGTHLSGAVTLGNGVMLGIGAVVTPGRRIGDATIVGAGAVLASHLPPGVVAYGVPARAQRALFEESDSTKTGKDRRLLRRTG